MVLLSSSDWSKNSEKIRMKMDVDREEKQPKEKKSLADPISSYRNKLYPFSTVGVQV